MPANAPGGVCPACLLQAGLEPVGSEAQMLSTAASGTGAFVAPSIDELNAKIPQLEFIELLGQGGMGAVYKARQPELDRLVAVKILPMEIGADSNFSERFSREAKALAKLNHPNIVTVYDFGQLEQQYFIVMEFIDGTELRHLIDVGQVSADEALEIVKQICEALQFAHSKGVVHRDIKPENILVDREGRVRIADFGLAKLLDTESVDLSLTGTRQVMGTFRYMAPEQTRGTKAVDHRADIFSLGVIFYELLTGDLPIGRFQLPSKKAATDARLDDVVLRALENEPADRYQQASDVNIDIDSIVSNPRIAPYMAAPAVAPSPPVKNKNDAGHNVAPFPTPVEGEFPTLNKKAIWGAGWFMIFLIGAFVIVFQTLTVQFSNSSTQGSSEFPSQVGSPIWYLVSLVLLVLVPVGVSSLVGTPYLGYRALGEIRRSNGTQFGIRLALFNIVIYPVLFVTMVFVPSIGLGFLELLILLGLFLGAAIFVANRYVKRLPGFREHKAVIRKKSPGSISRLRLLVLLVCINVAVVVLAFSFAPPTQGSFTAYTEFGKFWKRIWYFHQAALWITIASAVLSVGIYFFLTPESRHVDDRS